MTLRIAHRGAPHFAPENSLEGFEKALTFNPDYVEIDVRRSKDGHLIVMHDAAVKRMTDGRGKIAKMTLAQLHECRLPNGERIPTLPEVLDLLHGRVKIKLDVKVKSPAIAKQVVSELRHHGAMRGAIVIAYGKRALIAFRRASAKLRVEVGGVSFRPRRGAAIKLARKTGADILSVRHVIVTRKFIEKCTRYGLAIHAWTVNDPMIAARLSDYGVEGLATDRLDLI